MLLACLANFVDCYNLKLKGKRGFLSEKAWQRTLKGEKDRLYPYSIAYLQHTNLAIQPYQSYCTRAHRKAIRLLHEALKTHEVSLLG